MVLKYEQMRFKILVLKMPDYINCYNFVTLIFLTQFFSFLNINVNSVKMQR